MITYLTSDRKRRPLLHTLCALVLVFSLTIHPMTAFAEGDVPPATENTAAPTSETAPVSTPTTTPVAEPVTAPTAEAPVVAPTEVVTPTQAPESPVANQGPQKPTGADSTKYTFNVATGLWENDTYTWDPATNQTKPKVAPTYSYNPTTKQWDTTEWRYDAPSGKYVENTVTVPTLPAGAEVSPTSKTSTEQQTPKDGSSFGLTSDQSQNKPSSNNQSSGIYDLFYNAAISNIFGSQATTGDALVAGNTLAGSALSGTATAIATVLNLLQSSWDYVANGGLTTFVSNMFGDVFGDLLLDPGALTSTASAIPQDQLTVNATGSGTITNDLTLGATSGDASVTKNTTAGDATSGGAHVIANIINSIGSSISAGQSFLGILNIFGNFDGDVLVPSELLSLLGTPAEAVTTTAPSTTLTTTTTQAIDNSVISDAASGSATVATNTSAGTAKTGDAQTNVSILNLTGRQVIGKNALLVFVNVLGNWLGLIVDAPAGAKNAALGDASSSSATPAPNELTSSDAQTITNNLALTAHSGDAAVTKNTTAGNAISGDASTTANIVNMENSDLSLTDWFGILFINVFGNWRGSFGVDTAAGEVTATPNTPQTAQASSSNSSQQVSPLIQSSTNTFGRILQTTAVSSSTSDQTEQKTALLGTSTASDNTDFPIATTASVATNDDPLANPGINTFSILGTIFGLSLLGAERIYSSRDKKRSYLATKTTRKLL